MPLIQETYVDRILKSKVYDVAVETALETAPRLSRRLNNHVMFKREDLQPVFSFKIRALQYAYTEETENPAYKIFLAGGDLATYNLG